MILGCFGWRLPVMVMMWPWWLVPKVNPRELKRQPRIRFKLIALKKMPKLMQALKEQRCEGGDFNALELMFCKDILAHMRLHSFCKME
jgi:hypothetical protein